MSLTLPKMDNTKAIELDPKDADAYYNRGFAYKAKGDSAQAVRDFERYLELAPDAADREQVAA